MSNRDLWFQAYQSAYSAQEAFRVAFLADDSADNAEYVHASLKALMDITDQCWNAHLHHEEREGLCESCAGATRSMQRLEAKS